MDRTITSVVQAAYALTSPHPPRNLLISGDIDRDEWRETVEFYLELKEEEAEMHRQSADQAAMLKSVRRMKIDQLGKKGADQTGNHVHIVECTNTEKVIRKKSDSSRKEATIMDSVREGDGSDEEFLGMDIDA